MITSIEGQVGDLSLPVEGFETIQSDFNAPSTTNTTSAVSPEPMSLSLVASSETPMLLSDPGDVSTSEGDFRSIHSGYDGSHPTSESSKDNAMIMFVALGIVIFATGVLLGIGYASICSKNSSSEDISHPAFTIEDDEGGELMRIRQCVIVGTIFESAE